MDGFLGRVLVPAAQGMGHGDAGAYAETDEEVYNQIGDGAGGAHRRHGHAAAPAADNHQVRRVEEQLQKTGEDNRNGIKQNAGQQGPPEHPLRQSLLDFHDKTSVKKKRKITFTPLL